MLSFLFLHFKQVVLKNAPLSDENAVGLNPDAVGLYGRLAL
jgi:hypothetical protein